MTRREDLDRFYQILNQLEKVVGGKRQLSKCNSTTGWPTQGVYFFFEEGEKREDGSPRVVRIGTHAERNPNQSSTLWKRLYHHKGPVNKIGKHRTSIFRYHVGTALLEDLSRIPDWKSGGFEPRVITQEESDLEIQVSEHIGRMPFLWIDISGQEFYYLRNMIEENTIALLSNYGKSPIDKPSSNWLGYETKGEHRLKIHESGLWNVQKVDKKYDSAFLNKLQRLVDNMSGENNDTLVIVSCGKKKIWDKDPDIEPVRAKDAYTGGPTKKNMALAMYYGHPWMILSAKYGFINLDDLIEDYNASFKYKYTNPIKVEELVKQITEKTLDRYKKIIVLGGKEYLEAIEDAFKDTNCEITSPFRGLKSGQRMSAINKILSGEGESLPSPTQHGKVIEPRPSKHVATDEIRKYVCENIIEPAINRGLNEITIRAGDVEKAMGIKGRTPMFCSALKTKLDKQCNVTILNIEGPPSGQGPNLRVTYRL